MIRIILLSFISTSLAVVTLRAEPTPTPAPQKATKEQTAKQREAKKSAAASSPTDGWSMVKGTWIHPDGYKYVNGQVVRVGSQTHKRPPKPPTKAEQDAAKRTVAPPPADSAAAKAAERQRNLRPMPAPQTGSHL